jgi:peptidoglycan-N-acetylglucosamine deacetylase
MQNLGFFTVAFLAAAIACNSDLARAEDCPNKPDALGTSRILTVDPGRYPRIGAMEHAAALPLSDKEIVLTFDDGPVPRYTNQILDILAAQCVSATFFLVGRNGPCASSDSSPNFRGRSYHRGS